MNYEYVSPSYNRNYILYSSYYITKIHHLLNRQPLFHTCRVHPASVRPFTLVRYNSDGHHSVPATTVAEIINV